MRTTTINLPVDVCKKIHQDIFEDDTHKEVIDPIIIKLHFTRGNEGPVFAQLADAVSCVSGYVNHVSINRADRFYIVAIMKTSFSELTEMIEHESLDVDISEINEPMD